MSKPAPGNNSSSRLLSKTVLNFIYCFFRWQVYLLHVRSVLSKKRMLLRRWRGIHNDSIHYRDQLYQFRASASKESSSAAFPVSLISSAALHCHPSSALIRAWAQFTSLSSASKRGELHKEHSYRAMLKPSTGGLTALCQMGFAVLFIPSGKTRSRQMTIHQRQLWSKITEGKSTERMDCCFTRTFKGKFCVGAG